MPAQAVSAYKAHDVWGQFAGIGELHRPVMEIVLNPSELDLKEGTTAQIEATVYPANAIDRTLTWTSSDETIATVDAYGTAAALHAGQCTIRATAADGSGTTASIVCTVSPAAGIEEVAATDSDASFDVYTLQGRLLKKQCPRSEMSNLAPGLYIIRRGAEAHKIAVK